MTRVNLHGTGLVLGKVGVMLRGPSGAGKSLLAIELLDRWEGRGEPAWLVADDRLDIEAAPHGIVMHAPKAIEGLIELRGRGIVSRPFVRKADLHLVVDLVDDMDRMIEEDALETTLEGVRVARCPVPRAGRVDSLHQLILVREAVRAIGPAGAPKSRAKKTA
jgi:HPr kinase/phosphorylase